MDSFRSFLFIKASVLFVKKRAVTSTNALISEKQVDKTILYYTILIDIFRVF